MADTPQIEFAWDPSKAASNAIKHRVTFAQAATVFLDPLSLTMLDTEHSQVEERWFTLGMSSEGKFLAVSHTHMISNPDMTTCVSSPRAKSPAASAGSTRMS